MGNRNLFAKFSGVDSSFSVNVEPLIDGEVTLSVNNDSAFDLAGNGNSFTDFTLTYNGIAPSKPQELTVSEGDTRLILNWNQNNENDLDKYYIYTSQIENVNTMRYSGDEVYARFNAPVLIKFQCYIQFRCFH